MNIVELYKLTEWVQKELIDKKIAQDYTNLINILNQNINQKNQQLQPFDEQKQNLLEKLKEKQLNRLSLEQISVLDKVGLYQTIGEHTANKINEIFYKKGLDLATVKNEIQQIIDNFNNGIKKITQIRQGLSNIIEKDDFVLDENQIKIKIHFQKTASIKNVVDLKHWSTELHDIARGLAISQDVAPENISIVSAEKGSLIYTIGVTYAIVEIISKTILKALEIAERSLEIKRKVEEIKNLQLNNKKIEQELKKEAENQKKEEKDNLIEQLTTEYSIEDGEKRNALSQSIKKLIDFIEKGGEIDCYLPEETIEEENEEDKIESFRKINENFNRIRELEEKIELIEYHE